MKNIYIILLASLIYSCSKDNTMPKPPSDNPFPSELEDSECLTVWDKSSDKYYYSNCKGWFIWPFYNPDEGDAGGITQLYSFNGNDSFDVRLYTGEVLMNKDIQSADALDTVIHSYLTLGKKDIKIRSDTTKGWHAMFWKNGNFHVGSYNQDSLEIEVVNKSKIESIDYDTPYDDDKRFFIDVLIKGFFKRYEGMPNLPPYEFVEKEFMARFIITIK